MKLLRLPSTGSLCLKYVVRQPLGKPDLTRVSTTFRHHSLLCTNLRACGLPPVGEPESTTVASRRSHQLKLHACHIQLFSTAKAGSLPQPSAAVTSPATTTAAGYTSPATGLLSYLPRAWIPYAELIRLDKPTGTYYLFFPCLFSTLMAASYTTYPSIPVLTTSLLFFTGALIMRGAGCTINDIWDRKLDPHVQRTRFRPIARGAVTAQNAIVFTGFQMLAGLGLLLQFPTSCLYYGIPSLILVATYPLAKRVTHYPQVVLGFTFSWGAIMGFPALGVDLLTDPAALKAAAALYASCISWTVLYDMIYAHMDIKDDAKVGIKSIALRHDKETKVVLTGLAITQIGLLATAGVAIGAGPMFYIGSCGSAVATLGIMIWRVRLKEVANCWWWFRNGAWFTGGGIALGLLGDYYLRASAVGDTSDRGQGGPVIGVGSEDPLVDQRTH